MARRIQGGPQDMRDWMTRAEDQLTRAEEMPPGIARDEAIRKAEHLRSAAEMMGFLNSKDLKAPK